MTQDIAEQLRRQKWIDGSVCLSLLLETINSEISKGSYVRNINYFRMFTNMEIDELMLVDPVELTKRIQMYIISLKKTHSPNTIPTMIAPIKSLCEINDIVLNWKKINKFTPRREKLSGQSAWQTSQVRKMLDSTNKLFTKALIHVLASSGVRMGSLCDFKLKWLVDVEHGCKKMKVYADDIEEYTTFLTSEASEAVDAYLAERRADGEQLDGESYLFGHYSRSTLTMRIQRAIDMAKVRGTKVGTRYNTQIAHGFRKRFNTILKENNDVNDNAIEKMMGHKRGLDGTYLQITDENLLKHFLKGVDDLTIDDSFRLKKKSDGLQDQLVKIREEVRESVTAELEQQLSDIKYRQSKRLK